MTPRRASWIALCALPAVSASGLASAQPDLAAKAANWDRVAACRAISGSKERLKCVDAVLSPVGPQPALPASASPPRDATRPVVAAGGLPRNKDFGKPPAPQPKAQAEQAQQYVLAGIRELGPSRYLFITQTGETWEQLEGGKFVIPPEKGTRMTVKKTALGGYSCVFGRTVSMLCRRRS